MFMAAEGSCAEAKRNFQYFLYVTHTPDRSFQIAPFVGIFLDTCMVMAIESLKHHRGNDLHILVEDDSRL